ncbi:glycoside hydrolase family 5 protein [Tilletiaria anomala UBC 951]|uniref:Glycoside hydrolase family 5 protein n=1 Tax=Tilletiaria anomala (strain ATCC 24038 / CBS 436.72 / UBC 951) TaxID=1037660 RepID=A0A066VKP8_TILAU|nr:glycoside hydrolase family 5 protein [Tilletiaria anomala UBC 951]KDN42071.1 glycoside hydrolase family 5 protein [Tilletiaria anomala UBC 951]
MKLEAVAAATLLAAWVPATLALPSTRTLRGVSPYKALYYPETLDRSELQNLPPNRGGVSVAIETHRLEYQHPRWDPYNDKQRPEWADKVVKKLNKASDRLEKLSGSIGIDFAAVSAVAHWLSSKSEHARYPGYPKETFNLNHIFDQNDTATIQGRLPGGSGFPYGDPNSPVRGVNIGNWLLFELWMDPGLNSWLNDHSQNAPYNGAIIDEWTAGLYTDASFLTKTMNDHFNSWMTENDWKNIAAAGLNHVRIPIPYFAFPDLIGSAPYVAANRFDALKEGVLLAGKYGLKVWIDLHGVPGSQNGFDNSGHAGSINWPYNPSYYTATQQALNYLISEFSKDQYKGIVTGIEAVNEPQAQNNGDVKSLLNTYYPWAHEAIAHPNRDKSVSSNLTMVAHDGFLGLGYWANFWTGSNRDRVLLDKHPYFVYSDQQKQEKDTARLREVCALSDEIWNSNQLYPSIMGEWSTSGPNGDKSDDRDFPVNQSPVQFPSGPNYPYSQQYMVFLSRNWATQVQTYEYNAAGWVYWAWKNAGAPDWSYQTGLKYGWIPQDASTQPWGDDICNNL